MRLFQLSAYLISALLLAGCTGLTVTGEKVETRNVPHQVVRMDGESIAASGLDLPTVVWTDAEIGQYLATPHATTAMTVTLPGGAQLTLESPKNGELGSLAFDLDETGRITHFVIDRISYNASEPTAAREGVVEVLVDYAKSMSADRMAEFIAFVEMFDPELAEAILTRIRSP